MTLRTTRTEQKYKDFLATNPVHALEKAEPLVEFKHFIIINNRFPHDRIAHTHHMLIPKRVICHWTEMNFRERREFKKLDEYLSARYDCIKLNYPSMISIDYIVHWHLYRLK